MVYVQQSHEAYHHEIEKQTKLEQLYVLLVCHLPVSMIFYCVCKTSIDGERPIEPKKMN